MYDLYKQRRDLLKKYGKTKKDGDDDGLKVVKEKLAMNRISTVKLMADFGFCFYDCFELSFSDGVQATCALVAAYLGWVKLWRKAL
jgi:hypothetical protein